MIEEKNIYHKNLMIKLNLLQRIDISNPYHRLHQIENIFNYLNVNFEKIHTSNSSSHQRFIQKCRECAINILDEIDTVVFDDSYQFFNLTEQLKSRTKLILRNYIMRNMALTSPINPQDY